MNLVNNKQEINTLKKYIRNIPDFPKPGIQFKDITPLLQDAIMLRKAAKLLYAPYKDINIDYIVAVESRGFILGSVLAHTLNAGFIPVRKPDKLPSHKRTITYDLEYGQDSLAIHEDAFKHQSNKRILIHDDVLATGGTIQATSQLVKELNGDIVGYSFLVELCFLDGQSKLNRNTKYHSLIKYS